MRRRLSQARALSSRRSTARLGAAVLAVALLAAVAPMARAATACRVTYQVSSQWPGGFTANITITNLGDPLNGWRLEFQFPNASQRVTQGWSATWSQNGQNVTATSMSWNANLGTNQSTSIGFNGAWSGSNPVPTSFTINGVTCTGTGPTTTGPTTTGPTTTGPTTTGPTTTGPTTTAPTTTGPTTTAPTTTGPTTTLPPGQRVDNPYAGARGYVNPDWAAQVQQEAQRVGGSLGTAMQRVATQPTAVWLDRIGAITAGRGLRGHLDEALRQQQSSGQTVAITIVIYDLPNRDCAALASNGELLIAQNGLARYRSEYIDPIVSILSDPQYRSLRIVAIIEPDSIPNLVTNLSEPRCAEAESTNAYRDGIRYAISRLNTVPNTYLYLDIAHSGWLGWDSNFTPAVDRYVRLLDPGQGGPGFNSIHGFITNTANYTPTSEPFLTDSNQTVGGQPVRSAQFYEWNPYFDELDFAQALRNAFIQRGFPNSIGMLIDTSRNGWGGANRPTQVSTSTDLNTFVNESRIDRRPHRGGWCNQAGAGIGERPRANPATGIDAYVWVKPPGESDGTSEPDAPPPPDDPNKRHDPMCDPNARNRYNSSFPTNALDNAPHAGQWFPEQFRMLVQNAFPAL